MNLEMLLAEREIYRKIAAFARAMDRRDWQTLETMLAEDVSANLGAGEIAGRGEIVGFIRSFLDKCGTTQHLIGNVVINVEGDSATSQAYVSDIHLGKDTKSNLSFKTLGDYNDEWVCLEG
ncbi:MAG: nuclear transport factor 2 family protein, partial [Halieaceae bacterium]|nr:nuclear transport factor 2 family protein [Halieaceae bacterium]